MFQLKASGVRGLSGCQAVDLSRASISALLASALILVLGCVDLNFTAMAQTSNSEEQTISPFGKDITVREEDQRRDITDQVEIVRASAAGAEKIKELFSLGALHIVRLPASKELDDAVATSQEGVETLQLALESNALTHAALETQSIAAKDAIGARIEGSRDKVVTIYIRQTD